MSAQKWTAEHGNLLKSLRQNAGLDLATLARKHILSPAQIRQLENGGDTAFYNPDLKFATGKKLLLALGHPLPESALTEPSTSASPPVAASAAKASIPSSPIRLSFSPQNFVWLLLFLLIALGLLGWYVERSTDIQTPTQGPLPIAAPDQNSAPLPTNPEPALASTEAVLEKPAESITAERQEKLATAPAQCNWQTTEFEVTPTAPRKSADYVHLVAQQNVVVCIKDAEQRVATLEMQAGDARSIDGPPPFKVYSANLSGMQIYFQGQAIKLPSDEVKLLRLSAAGR